MANTDSAVKRFFNANDRFADIFNLVLNDGNPLIRPEDLQEVSPESFSMSVDGASKYRDILKSIVFRESRDVIYALFGLEIQTYVDYTIVLRCMEYNLLRYRQEVNQISQQHRAAKDLKERDEVFSGFGKKDRITPIVTLVLYLKDKPWNGFRSLNEMLKPVGTALQPYVNNFAVNVFELCQLTEEGCKKLRSSLGNFFRWLKAAGSTKEALLKMAEKEKTIDNEIIEAINEVQEAKMRIDVTQTRTDAEISVKEWLASQRLEGRQEGIQEGRQEGFLEGIQAESNRRVRQFINLERSKGISEADIKSDLMVYFEIPEDEIAKYMN